MIAVDKDQVPIYRNSKLYYRGELCSIIWDKERLSFYLSYYDEATQRTVSDIPFDSYIAKECEVALV